MNEFSKQESGWFQDLVKMRDLLLGNLVLVSQIPAETFQESARAEWTLNRFMENENVNAYQDEMGNVVGVLKGRNSERKVALTASMDTRFSNDMDHDLVIKVDKAVGVGVGNNSLGLAALVSLPEILERLGLEFDCDLILVATTQSLGKGDLAGMRHFIKTYPFGIDFVLNLVSTNIGRVDHFSHSTVRADIVCKIDSPDEYTSLGFGNNNAILILNELINALLDIPMSSRPKVTMNIGQVHGGESYSTPCPKASLNLYVRSEDDRVTGEIIDAIQDCCIDIGSKNQTHLNFHTFGRQMASGLRFSHPLVKTAIGLVEKLGYRPVVAPTNTQITVPLSQNIPSITIGVSTGKHIMLPEGYVDLGPIPHGLLQIIMLLCEIDKGDCDANPK